MAVHKVITSPGIYYITFTCYKWLHLIEITQAYDLVYNWFDVMVKNGNAICAFTIMPNHLHVILYYAGGKKSLNTQVGNGKRFIAYEIVQRLTKMGRTDILKMVELGVQNKDRSRGKKHEIWIGSFDAKECRTEKFLCQKMHYMHNNPCHPRWSLSPEPHLYPHSSALFYMNGKTAAYPVTDYWKFITMYYPNE